MELIPLSFIAGVLTVLAPCILPLLPVIVGGSVADRNPWRPVVITASLAGSIVLFTLLLKFSSALVSIPASFWKYFSAGIVLLFACTLLFPITWAKILHHLGINKIEQKAQTSLYTNSKKSNLVGMIATGGALGPVFASCSPTYFFVLGTVLPQSWLVGIFNLSAYAIGLSLVMFAVAFAGQRVMHRLGDLSNPHGWFKRILGIIFLLVGLAIATGYDKKIEATILNAGYFDVTAIEQRLLDKQLDKQESTTTPAPDPQSPEPVSDRRLNMQGTPGELLGTGEWYNSQPIDSLQDLQGRVVALKFWTYSCINCIRTLDETQKLWEKYEDEDFVLLGVHTPEFAFEKDPEAVRHEIEKYGLTFPVVQDNDFETWRSFNNRYWPAWYLIDRDGVIRYTHFGEGRYQEKEDLVGILLEE